MKLNSGITEFAKLAFVHLSLVEAIPMARQNRLPILFGFNEIKAYQGGGSYDRISLRSVSSITDFSVIGLKRETLALVEPFEIPPKTDLSGLSLKHLKFHIYGFGRQSPLNPTTRPIKLAGVNLQGADLSGLTLVCIDFTGADLRGADLRGANLRGCCLDGADLKGAIIDKTTIFGDWEFIDKTVKRASYRNTKGLPQNHSLHYSNYSKR